RIPASSRHQLRAWLDHELVRDRIVHPCQPLLGYPSTLLGCLHALVSSLEQLFSAGLHLGGARIGGTHTLSCCLNVLSGTIQQVLNA
ncbi:hypothetical protein ACFPQ7_19635, partial [Methylobacterium iners]|uniref:hypothetical protein n=1 Tax=Methylobacterium iners TaxID=418707 RepID=UPI00361EA00B